MFSLGFSAVTEREKGLADVIGQVRNKGGKYQDTFLGIIFYLCNIFCPDQLKIIFDRITIFDNNIGNNIQAA